MAKVKHTNLMISMPIVAIAALGLGACTQGTGLVPSTSAQDGQVQAQNQAQAQGGTANTPPAPQKAFNRFPDIPVPTRAEMDTARTLVFGSGESWYGQLGLDTDHNADSIFDFYKQELAGFGWQEITSVRAQLSVLTYERQGRILSIQIQTGSLGGAFVTLTVSPRGGAAPVMN